MVTTTLSFKTEDQSIWGSDVPTGRITTGDRFILDFDERVPLDFNIGILALEGDLVFRGRAGLEAYVDLSTAGTFDATAELNVDLDYTRAVYTRDGNNFQLTFDFSNYTYGRSSLNHLGFGLDESGEATSTVGIDFIIDIEGGLRDFSFWAGLPSVDLGLLGETPRITLFDEDVGDFDFPSIDARVPLFALGAGDKLYEYENKSGSVGATIKLPAGAKIDAIANGLSKVEGEEVSPVTFLEAEADLDKLFTQGLKALGVVTGGATAAVAKKLEKTIFFEKFYDASDYVPFLPEGKLYAGLKALDLQFDAGASVKERASLDLANGGSEADVSVALVFDPTPENLNDQHLNTTTNTKLGEVHSFSLDAATFGAIDEGIGNAQVTAIYDLKADYELGMGLDVRGAFTVTALKAEFNGTLFHDDAQYELTAYEDTFPEGGIGFDFIIPDVHSYEVSAFNSVTEVYDVAYSDFAPSGYNANAAGADDALLAFIETVENSALISLTELLGGATGTAVDASGPVQLSERRLDAVDAAIAVSGANAGNVINPFFYTGGNTRLTSWDPSDWVLFEIADGAAGQNVGMEMFYGPHAAGADRSFFGTIALLDALGNPDANISSVAFHVGPFVHLDWRTADVSHTPSVNVVAGGGDDFVAYVPGPNAQYFDGGEGNDTFIANLANDTNARSASINTTFWGDGTKLPSAFAGTDLQVNNFENFFLNLGNGDDEIVIGRVASGAAGQDTQNYIHTGAGNDYVAMTVTTGSSLSFPTDADFFGDFDRDVVQLGAGDDTALAYANAWGLPNVSDHYSGGTGLDAAKVLLGRTFLNDTRTSGDSNVGINIETKDGDLVFDDNGIVGTASTQQLGALLSAYQTHIVEEPGDLTSETLIKPASTGATTSAIHYTQGTSSNFARTVFFADMEAVGVFANSGLNNIALFTGATGAHAYKGATAGTGSGTNTFVADFGITQTLETADISGNAITARLKDIESATVDISDYENISFVNGSGIRQFDRLYLRGTEGNDRFIASSDFSRTDYLDGRDGDDYLDGGNDTAADRLIGGLGSDVFRWSNDGRDTVTGGTLFNNEAEGDLDWLIVGDRNDTTVSAGLNYRFTANLFNQPLNSTPAVNAESSFSSLVNLLNSDPFSGLSLFNIGYGTSLGVEFRGIERTNVVGSDTYDDLVVYQQGAFYDLGETADDADVFVGKFTNSEVGITFGITEDETTGQMLENGTEVRGADRAILLGSNERDNFKGGDLQDYLSGGAGDDTLDGGAGDDVLRGGAGDDVLRWRGQGNATIDGGTGTDQLVIGDPEAQLTSAVQWQFYDADNSPKTDVLSATSNMFSIFGPTFEQTPEETAEVIIGGNRVNFVNVEGVSIIGSDAQSDLFIHNEGLLYFGGRGTAIDTFAARLSTVTEDLVLRADGRDAYNNTETDPVYWSIGNGAEIAEMERFVLLSGTGDDHIVGGNTDQGDLFSGNSGNDTMETGGGLNDRLEGNAGDDLLIANAGTMGAMLDGQVGFDRFQGSLTGTTTLEVMGDAFTVLSGPHDAAGFTLADADAILGAVTNESGIRYYSDGEAAFVVLGTEQHHVTAGGGDDLLLASADDAVLYGGAGADVLISRAGDDLLVGESGLDTYVFGTGFGDDIIAAEDLRGGRLMFSALDFADLDFSAVDRDLLVTTDEGTVRLRDYFQAGGTGADFEIVTRDGTQRPDLSALGGAAVTALARADRTSGEETSDLGAQALNTSAASGNAAARADLGVVLGGQGDDQIIAFDGADVIDGGRGDDAVYYTYSSAGVELNLATGLGRGGAAQGDVFVDVENAVASAFDDTVMGTEGNNFIDGAASDDMLMGHGGDDEIFGGAGADTVEGGAGEDALSGGLGADVVDGGDGEDVVSGQQGNDTLRGGDGTDILFGGEGDDLLQGDAGIDVLYGDAGRDTIDGGAGDNDRVDYTQSDAAVDVDLTRATQIGSAAQGDMLISIEDVAGSLLNDTLMGDDLGNILAGQDGDDALSGRDGADILFGGAGVDSLSGDAGDDVLTGGAGADVLNGGAGRDLASYVSAEAGVVADLADTSRNTGDAAGDSYVQIEGLVGSEYDDALHAGATSAFIEAGDGADTLMGGAGSDTLQGGEGADTLDGGDGFDVASFADAAEALVLTLGDLADAPDYVAEDTLISIEGLRGSAFDDALTGDAERNILEGDAGNDTLNGGAGSDNVTGGTGDDVLIGGDGFDWLTPGSGNDDIRGGDGVDMVSFIDQGQGVIVDFAAGTVRTGFDTNTIEEVENVTGSIWGDFMRGDDGDNRMRGMGNYDWMVGSDGQDTLDGGQGRDMVSYIEAEARVTVDLGQQRGLAGQAADDTYVGVERVTGSIYSDLFYGSGGEDEFRGAGGFDWFVGSGGGRDRYDGGVGKDTVSYASSVAGVSASLTLGRGSSGDAARDLYTSIENLTGTNADDDLTGDNGRNVLRGLYGEDRLLGNGGVDRLTGGGSDDYLDGGASFDYAFFSNDRSDYTITTAGEVTTVAYNRSGGDGTDTLVNIEVLVFADGELFL